MVHIHSLEPRTLFAVGLDTSFGSGGIVRLNSFPDAVTLSAGGAVFAETYATTVSDSFFRSLSKYTAAGRLDTTWGDGGTVNLPYFEADAMAYDRRTGALYVAGQQELAFADDPAEALVIVRLTKDGSFDPTFGPNGSGRVIFTPPQTSGIRRIAVGELIALPGDRLLVAVDRRVSDGRDTQGNPTGRVTGDVSVMRLRSGGTRDPSFGDRGVVTVLGTTARVTSGNYVGEHTTFHDLAIGEDGTYKVVLTRESGTIGPTLQGRDFNFSVTTAKVSVKARTISAAGVIDPAKAYSWTLADGDANVAGDDGFITPLIRYAGGDRVVSIAQAFDARRVSYSTPLGFTLTPGRRPTSVKLPVLNAQQAAFSASGFFFVGSDTAVSRLRPDFSLDRRFADQGTATTGRDDPVSTYTPDADGGVLVRVGYQRLVRFA